MFVRPARPEDVENFITWSMNTKDNLFDPDTTNYPSTAVLCAFNEHGPIVYCPIQHPFFMEHLAIKPGASPIDVAVALKAITDAVVTQAYLKGVGEIYFLCKDESTINFAKTIYEELPWKIFRLKLKNLEGTNENAEVKS